MTVPRSHEEAISLAKSIRSRARDLAVIDLCDWVIRSAATATAIALVARGRPRVEQREQTIEAQRPWEALGMSRRTWYRRRREAAKPESDF